MFNGAVGTLTEGQARTGSKEEPYLIGSLT